MPKSIEQRLDSLKDNLLVFSINRTLDELIAKSEEEQHVCLGDQCENNIASKCRGSEHLACSGNCGGHHAKEYDQAGNEIKTKTLGSSISNHIVCDDSSVVEGFYLPGGY